MLDKILELEQETKGEISLSIKDEKFKPIIKDDVWIGFLTWFLHGDKVFVNNLYIEPEYRNKDNLLFIRNFLREKYKGKNAYWFNKKHNERKFIGR